MDVLSNITQHSPCINTIQFVKIKIKSFSKSRIGIWTHKHMFFLAQAWEFSGFFLISGFFRAQKILKSSQIMHILNILNKNMIKIVPWS